MFYDRTIDFQFGRDSPFSLWDWRQYHAGLPDLHPLQLVLEGALLVGALPCSSSRGGSRRSSSPR